jgi:predicted secreted hydrolase
MKPSRLLLILIAGAALHAAPAQSPWRQALPGWEYVFPRDHGFHAGFRTEWWYFTGHLQGEDGSRFGYQLTFFRRGIRPPGAQPPVRSRFIVEDLKFAHFAVTDLRSKKFHFSQRVSRGAFGEAGFQPAVPDGASRLAWIEDWTLDWTPGGGPGGTWRFSAADEGVALALELRSAKPWVFHGENGVSQKAEGAGRASHYYSGTRLECTGTLRDGERESRVRGLSWLDREWGSNQLTREQIGWNWFSMQFDDGTELMLYQMRLRDGGVDPNSSGTFVAADGAAIHLRRADYSLTPRRWWTSPATGGRYPVAWDFEVPALDLRGTASTPLDAQELVLNPVAYWEGLIDLRARRDAREITGEGYLEMTGYAGELRALSE